MKKLLIASAVTAAFANPGSTFAQATSGVPTLDKVLEASGISVSGYIDAIYTRADRDIQAGIAGSGAAPRVFDNQNNSFGVQQAAVTLAKQPKEGFGALVNLTTGSVAQVIHSQPEPTGGNSSMFDVTQAYAQYATGPLTVIMGKFITLHGTEYIASPGNTNISRSILFGAIPYTHTGVRATFVASDAVTLMVGANNGWDQASDVNKGKTAELGATLTPVKPLTINLSAMSGEEPIGVAVNAKRDSLSATATYAVTDALSVGLEVLSVSQDKVGPGGAKAKYSGEALYITYMLNPKWRAVLRAEQFSDSDGVRFGIANTKYSEATLTLAYLPNASVELRGEIRSDSADKALYQDSRSVTPSKGFSTLAVQALYKF